MPPFWHVARSAPLFSTSLSVLILELRGTKKTSVDTMPSSTCLQTHVRGAFSRLIVDMGGLPSISGTTPGQVTLSYKRKQAEQTIKHKPLKLKPLSMTSASVPAFRSLL